LTKDQLGKVIGKLRSSFCTPFLQLSDLYMWLTDEKWYLRLSTGTFRRTTLLLYLFAGSKQTLKNEMNLIHNSVNI